jgi:hypothetical protein
MAKIKCPSNVSSITLSTSGVLTPDSAGIITCTAAEATALSKSTVVNSLRTARLVSTAANGDVQISLPVVVTGITINSVAYTKGSATPFGELLSAAVPAAAASILLYQNFSLVNG